MFYKHIRNKRGINTVEVVIILAILLGLALLFREYITEFVANLFERINRDTDQILQMLDPALRIPISLFIRLFDQGR